MAIYADRSVGGGAGSQISGFAQALEGVLGFVIHGAAGAFRYLGGVELGDDLVDGAGMRFDREGDVGVTQRAITLACVCEVERDDGNAFAPRIGPDVALG